MKNVLTIILSFICLSIFSQAEDQNFYLNDAEVSWQKAYSTNKTQQEVYTYFENSNIFNVVKIENNQVIGRLNLHATNPKKTGVAAVPEIVNKTDFKGDVIVKYREKEKDYVVTFKNIILVGRGDFLKKKEEQTFEDNFLRAGVSEYRPYFLRKPKKVYNLTFIPIFEIK